MGIQVSLERYERLTERRKRRRLAESEATIHGEVNSIKTPFLQKQLKLVLEQKLKERMLLLKQKALTYTVLVLQKEVTELQ